MAVRHIYQVLNAPSELQAQERRCPFELQRAAAWGAALGLCVLS